MTRPKNVAVSCNVQTFGDTLKTLADRRLDQGSNKVLSVRRDRNACTGSQMTWYLELLLLASRNRWGDCKAARSTAALFATLKTTGPVLPDLNSYLSPMFTIVMLQWVAIFFAEVCCLCVHCELPIPCTPAAGTGR